MFIWLSVPLGVIETEGGSGSPQATLLPVDAVSLTGPSPALLWARTVALKVEPSLISSFPRSNVWAKPLVCLTLPFMVTM